MEKQKQFFVALGIVVILGSVIAIRLWGSNAAQAEQATAAELRPAAVAVVTRGPLVSAISLSGAFRPYQEVDVHAKVAGYIRHIYVDVGDKVKAGQELAVLEVPELNAQVVGARADMRCNQDAIRRSRSEIERARSTHVAYHAAYTRLKQASDARPGLIAEQELDDALAKDKETEAQVSSAEAALSEAEGQLGVAQANLERLSALESYAHITAPFPGVVTKRYADTGALIQAGTASDTQSMPVVQLAEWSRLRLVVPVPESSVPKLHIGSSVQVHVSALNRDFQGKVARFADALSDETRTMHTEIDVENPDGTLKDGMYAEAKLVLSQQAGVLTVPIQAVERTATGATVLVVDASNRIEQRPVQLGTEGSDRVAVLSGLAENDKVVVGNRGGFRAGERVVPKVVKTNLDAEAAL
ncbi:MAG: efflux RND transporter periplasmic adaptor subunit [Acidobacteria bacterium]|nr:efflux RND transporter periplasmic adaptor subunit [Acidobacteriota bacterium]